MNYEVKDLGNTKEILYRLENGESFILKVCKKCGLEWRGLGVTEESPCPRCKINDNEFRIGRAIYHTL